MYRIRLRCKFFLLQHNFGPVQKYPDIFESATFSFRIRLPPTRIQPVSPSYESETFLIRSPEWKFWNTLCIRKSSTWLNHEFSGFYFKWKNFSHLCETWHAVSFPRLHPFDELFHCQSKSRDPLSPCNGQNVSTKVGNTYSKCICFILSFFYGSLQERVAC